MTRVMLVYNATRMHEVQRKVDTNEIAECDLLIGLNEEGSEGVVLKDRFGKADVPVKVVN